MEKAIANIEHIPRGFEALMFAIYSMAVVSLSEDKCKEMLGESRATLLPHYVAATKAALSRARFMSSTSIVVLQALVLHILSIRDVYEPRAVWSLTGVAIRVAEGMGMRLDGKLMGLSPFESEIRRRIWWQINLHDFRAAELCGQAKFRDFKLDETTPTKPANVNDSDLYPVMPRAPVESTRPTEMVWCMLRAELATFAAAQIAKMQKLSKAALTTSEEFAAMDDLKRKDTFIQELEDTIETDPTILRSVPATATPGLARRSDVNKPHPVRRSSSTQMGQPLGQSGSGSSVRTAGGLEHCHSASGAVQHDAVISAASTLRLERPLFHPVARRHPRPRHTASRPPPPRRCEGVAAHRHPVRKQCGASAEHREADLRGHRQSLLESIQCSRSRSGEREKESF
jgi:Fungal specific transcription factor domain